MAAEQQGNRQEIEFYGGIEVYSETGVDLSLLRENLRRSPEERWQAACNGATLFRAWRRPDGSPVSPQAGDPSRQVQFDAAGMLRPLVERGVEFVVVGALAMSAHGSAYLTDDLDLCYRRTPKNHAALAAA
jgi:hypothetical protein